MYFGDCEQGFKQFETVFTITGSTLVFKNLQLLSGYSLASPS